MDTSDLNFTALHLPSSTTTDDAELLAQLAKYPVTSPPPFALPAEDIERDKAHIRAALQARGERRDYWNDEEEERDEGQDEDVNGFFASGVGKKVAKKRVSCSIYLDRSGEQHADIEVFVIGD